MLPLDANCLCLCDGDVVQVLMVGFMSDGVCPRGCSASLLIDGSAGLSVLAY